VSTLCTAQDHTARPNAMNFLIRRTSKKEYDGPAASASVLSGVTDDPFLVAFNKQKMVVGGDRRRHSSSSSRQSTRGHSSSRVSGYNTKDDQQQHPSRRQSSSSLSSSRQRSSSDKQSQPQLASGISSRRTSHRVKNHLPAHMMSSKTISNIASSNTSHQDRHSITRRSSGGDSAYSKSHASCNSCSSASQPQYEQRKQSIQIPMEHDGGILCLEPVPAANKGNCKYRQGCDDGTTHRFLSGGTDGTVKLWEVFEPPFESTETAANGGALVPRLVKTYRGHRGYVHSIAILGTFDPMEKGSCQQQLQQDQESCTTEEMDNISFSSSPFSRRSNEKKGSVTLIKKLGRRKRDLFVTASRDNTLRIWELDNSNEHDEYFEGSSDDEFNNSRKKDPLRKGKKLRGHEFAVNGGVLCVCAVPSLPSSSSGFMSDVEEQGMTSAGQFVSGGSDGVVRVWDVRSALNLEKVPKSGMYHTIQVQRLNPFSSHDSEDEDESTIAASIQSGEGSSRGVAVPVTSLKCTHSDSIGLFASYADGLIRHYSSMNISISSGHVNSAIRWCLTSIFSGHKHAVTSLTLLSSTSLLSLLSPDVEQRRSNDQTGTILISSSVEGSIRVWSALECSEKSEGSVHKRAALWEIELNDDEAGTDNESNDGGDRPPTSINVRTLVEPVGVISLTALNKGGIMAAGTTDGRIRLWDVSSGLYEGTYNLGKSVQVWSLAVLSERDLYRGYDEFGELQIHIASIIIAGDNRGRLRILRKMSMRSATEGEAEEDEIDRIFGS
jgi:hypothetical protein